jgi:hypothetical protein
MGWKTRAIVLVVLAGAVGLFLPLGDWTVLYRSVENQNDVPQDFVTRREKSWLFGDDLVGENGKLYLEI